MCIYLFITDTGKLNEYQVAPADKIDSPPDLKDDETFEGEESDHRLRFTTRNNKV